MSSKTNIDFFFFFFTNHILSLNRVKVNMFLLLQLISWSSSNFRKKNTSNWINPIVNDIKISRHTFTFHIFLNDQTSSCGSNNINWTEYNSWCFNQYNCSVARFQPRREIRQHQLHDKKGQSSFLGSPAGPRLSLPWELRSGEISGTLLWWVIIVVIYCFINI